MNEHVPAAECRFRGSQSPTTERLRGNTQTISQKAKKVASGSRTHSQQRQAGRGSFFDRKLYILQQQGLAPGIEARVIPSGNRIFKTREIFGVL